MSVCWYRTIGRECLRQLSMKTFSSKKTKTPWQCHKIVIKNREKYFFEYQQKCIYIDTFFQNISHIFFLPEIWTTFRQTFFFVIVVKKKNFSKILTLHEDKIRLKWHLLKDVNLLFFLFELIFDWISIEKKFH